MKYKKKKRRNYDLNNKSKVKISLNQKKQQYLSCIKCNMKKKKKGPFAQI